MGTTKIWCVLSFGFFLGSLFTIGCGSGGGAAIAQSVANAIDVAFDNAASGMASTEVQSALEELNAQIAVLQGANTALQTRATDLETKTASITVANNNVYFTGVNMHLRNGSGATDNANGTGNLIVGYDENVNNTKTGSHNVVIGAYHTYTSYGGFIAGFGNAITARGASVCGGNSNTASGIGATVSGGISNLASGNIASVSGGDENIASGTYASVSGGVKNTASGTGAAISGGHANSASGEASAVSGGELNSADYEDSTVSGGYNVDTLANADHRP